jgi:hypothetical protein
MEIKFAAIKEKLKTPVTQRFVAYSTGAVTGSIVTAALVYYKTKHDYDNLLTLPLGKEAFDALVNDETNFVRFWTTKHDHAFRVILEQ